MDVQGASKRKKNYLHIMSGDRWGAGTDAWLEAVKCTRVSGVFHDTQGILHSGAVRVLKQTASSLLKAADFFV